MKNKNIQRHTLEKISLSDVYGGSPDPQGDLIYDLSYLLGYGFAWISNYIGNHVADYGLAFK
jgi:hypothetical protein